MKKYMIISCLVLALAGCKSMRTKQMTGSDVVQDSDGKSKFVTYVTPEEYDRMTDEERKRLRATVGVSASVPLPGSKAPSEAISEEDFKKAYAK